MSDQAALLSQIVSLPELEERARQCMSSMVYDYVSSGAADEITVNRNREAFNRIAVWPRVLTGIDAPDTSLSIFGTIMPTPILLGPTAYHRVLHPDGEIATARGASATGVTWIVSSAATTSVEDIAREATAPLWFQLYFQSDREFTREVVERAVAQLPALRLC